MRRYYIGDHYDVERLVRLFSNFYDEAAKSNSYLDISKEMNQKLSNDKARVSKEEFKTLLEAANIAEIEKERSYEKWMYENNRTIPEDTSDKESFINWQLECLWWCIEDDGYVIVNDTFFGIIDDWYEKKDNQVSIKVRNGY